MSPMHIAFTPQAHWLLQWFCEALPVLCFPLPQTLSTQSWEYRGERRFSDLPVWVVSLFRSHSFTLGHGFENKALSVSACWRKICLNHPVGPEPRQMYRVRILRSYEFMIIPFLHGSLIISSGKNCIDCIGIFGLFELLALHYWIYTSSHAWNNSNCDWLLVWNFAND